jgi:hypothetical protein
MHLNKNNGCQVLMAEDIVVVVHDWNEGEAVPIQCLWLLLVDC